MPWNHVSASQLKAAASCPRLWWFEKISDLPKPAPTKALLDGSEIHRQVECYLKTGALPTDKRAESIAKLFPTVPLTTLHSEVRVDFTAGEMPLVGFIDLIDFRNGTVEIIDFKTVSDWKYAKTPEELRIDFQMVPYAAWAYDTFDADSVIVKHIQVNKKTNETATVSAELTAAEVQKVWTDQINPLVSKMVEWSKATTPEDVPGVKSHCSAFGGCPFLSVCSLGKQAKIPQAAGQTGDKMSHLRDLIRQRAAAAAAASVTAEPAPAEPAPAEPAPAEPAPAPALSARYAEAAARLEGCAPMPAKELKALIGPILGFERVAWNHVEAVWGMVQNKNGLTLSLRGLEFAPPVVAQNSPISAPPPVTPTLTPPNAVAARPDAFPMQERGLVVLIDCAPLGGATATTLEAYLQPHIDTLSAAVGAPLFSLDYRAGERQLAAHLANQSPPTGLLLVDSGHSAWRELSQILLPRASLIIKGTR